MPKLLVVDDEKSILLAFQKAFRNEEVEVVTAQTGAEGIALAQSERPGVVVLDVQLPDQSGLEVMSQLREYDARCPVIFISGKSTTSTAIEAMKQGAFEYLLKPLELSQLRRVIDQAFEISRMMEVPAVVADEMPADDHADAIVGRCAAMQEVYKAIGRVANQDVTVLITGESGTGKELVARAIYQHSRRAAGPFLAINSAAIPEALVESELFGHEKGAFTGADRQRIGKLEQCTGGTLFLDEVAELSLVAQSKMLRWLGDQTFERLGGNETIRSDVRLLAATNQDLEARVKDGRFRPDLFYRLSVFTIHLPALREREDDFGLLVHHFVRRFSQELGKEISQVAPPTMEMLRVHSWPGNVREMQSVLKQALLQASGHVLIPEFLPSHFRKDASDSTEMRSGFGKEEATVALPALGQFIDEQLRGGAVNLYDATLRRMDRILLTRVLQYTGGNQLQAAKILGITRGSLRTKLRDLGITISRQVASGQEVDQ
jgi:two-component system nitrogen regulation response regulator GlnG